MWISCEFSGTLHAHMTWYKWWALLWVCCAACSLVMNMRLNRCSDLQNTCKHWKRVWSHGTTTSSILTKWACSWLQSKIYIWFLINDCPLCCVLISQCEHASMLKSLSTSAYYTHRLCVVKKSSVYIKKNPTFSGVCLVNRFIKKLRNPFFLCTQTWRARVKLLLCAEWHNVYIHTFGHSS